MNIPKEIQAKIPAVLVGVIEARFDDAMATTNPYNVNQVRRAINKCVAPLAGKCHPAVFRSLKSHLLENFYHQTQD